VDLALLAWILALSLDILLSGPSPSPAEHLSGSVDPTAWLAGLLFKMLISRETTNIVMTSDTIASIISSLAHRLIAGTSLGLRSSET